MATPDQNAELWDQAIRDVSARGEFNVGIPSVDPESREQSPPDADEDGFWDAVEARCIELGGTPPGPRMG